VCLLLQQSLPKARISRFSGIHIQAKTSEVMNKAAKCELAARKLNYSYSPNQYSIKATVQLFMKLEYHSHELLEYQLAYDVARNYHYVVLAL
jgi:hypothetical protein